MMRSDKCAVFFLLIASTDGLFRDPLAQEIPLSARYRVKCSKRLPSKRYFFSHDNSCATAQECVDRTTFKATIRDENREAAPRPRHCCVLNRIHTRASSLAKMSAGIPNPCGHIDQPNHARPGRMVTAGSSRLAEQPLRRGGGCT